MRDKHHAAYAEADNDGLDRLAEAREKGDYATLVGSEKTFAFNLPIPGTRLSRDRSGWAGGRALTWSA